MVHFLVEQRSRLEALRHVLSLALVITVISAAFLILDAPDVAADGDQNSRDLSLITGVAGGATAGGLIGDQLCGRRCAIVGSGIGGVVGGAIVIGTVLGEPRKPPQKVVQRDAAAAERNLPPSSLATPQNSPQPRCQIGFGWHGRAKCTWH